MAKGKKKETPEQQRERRLAQTAESYRRRHDEALRTIMPDGKLPKGVGGKPRGFGGTLTRPR